MKARINGKIYDTESAREIGRNGGSSLYTKLRGTCFCAGENGIKPLTVDEAKEWIDCHLGLEDKADALKKLPRRSVGETRIPVNSYLAPGEKARLDRLREERGFEAADIMSAGIDALERGLL